MEIVVVAVAFVAFIIWVSRVGTSKATDEPQKHSATTRRYPVPKPRHRNQQTVPSTFDARSATPVRSEEILSGAAWVVDGDTIKINKTQIRLFGIDAPELNHPYGQRAKWALHHLCKNQIIRAQITEKDEYGRAVAHCFLPDGRDLSAEMVKQGMAIDWPKFSGGKYLSLETADARKKMFLADARQKGRMYVWERFEAKQQKK